MKTEAEIRTAWMQALIDALGLAEGEPVMMGVSRDRFGDTEWRRHGLLEIPLDVPSQTESCYAEELHAKQ